MRLRSDDKTIRLRLDICESCRHFRKKTRTCGTPVIGNKVGNKRTCGCFMDLKTKLSFASCPLGKWGNLQIDHEDFLAIKNLINEIKNVINADQKKVLFEMQKKYFGGNIKTSNCVPCLKKALSQMRQLVDEYESK